MTFQDRLEIGLKKSKEKSLRALNRDEKQSILSQLECLDTKSLG